MLWLIWIAIILLTPIAVGVSVWHELHQRAEEHAAAESPTGQANELT